MSAVLIVRRQEVVVPDGQTIRDALQALDLHPEQFLAVRDGKVVSVDEVLREGDVVRLVAAVSGGALA